MQLFQFSQEKFAILGIMPDQQFPFNRRIQMCFTWFWLANVQNLILLSYKPSGFMEYTNLIFITSGTIIVALCYTILIIKMNRFFEFIELAEELTDSGEWDSYVI